GSTVTISGVKNGDVITYTTASDHNRVLIGNANPTSGSGSNVTFDIGGFSIVHTTAARAEDGSHLLLENPRPSITATGSGPALSVDESFLTVATNGIAGSGTGAPGQTVATGDFSTAFTFAAGADGDTVTYALSITGGNGTPSGLIDSQTGQADVLVQS